MQSLLKPQINGPDVSHSGVEQVVHTLFIVPAEDKYHADISISK